MATPKSTKIARSDVDMLGALCKHLDLLAEFSERCFDKGETHLLGEVAGKLRLLLLENATNKPLLLGLMDKFGSKAIVKFDKPWNQGTKTLREYRDDLCFVMKLPSGHQAKLSNLQVVRLIAEQHGSAHEDWDHDEVLATVRQSGPFVGDQPIFVPMIRAIARTTVSVAGVFIHELQQKGLLKRVRGAV